MRSVSETDKEKTINLKAFFDLPERLRRAAKQCHILDCELMELAADNIEYLENVKETQ